MFLIVCFQVKSEVCLSPDHLLSPSLSPQSSSYAASSSGGMAATNTNSSTTINNNIKFGPLLPQKWCKVYDANLQVLKQNSQTIIGWYCYRIPRWLVNMYFLTFFSGDADTKAGGGSGQGFQFLYYWWLFHCTKEKSLSGIFKKDFSPRLPLGTISPPPLTCCCVVVVSSNLPFCRFDISISFVNFLLLL